MVEDDDFILGIYQKKLEMEGFRVTSANNGEKGLFEAKSKNPDIILLDILLPKVDGFSVLKKLKEDGATQKIPVILWSNLGQRDDVEKGLKMGAVDYLIKTHFKPSEVVDKIKKVLKV